MDSKDIKVQWTAYKFTNKTPVKGTFNTTELIGTTSAKTLAELALGLKMDIDGASFESGDPGRNATVQQFFFEKFNPPFKMRASVKDMQGNDRQGTIVIDIDMNGATKSIPFAYTVSEENLLEAKSSLEMMDFNLKGAYDSLHDACEVLHTGEDGVSKTWTEVGLLLTGKFQKQCPAEK
jgi:hypothetical protein